MKENVLNKSTIFAILIVSFTTPLSALTREEYIKMDPLLQRTYSLLKDGKDMYDDIVPLNYNGKSH